MLKDRIVSDEVIQTALVEVEGLLNSRPLTCLSTDSDDFTPLTPNHFLIGRASPHTPLHVMDEKDLNARRRWIRVQELTYHFWRRWICEHLPTINQRRKWNHEQPEIQEICDDANDDVQVSIKESGHDIYSRISHSFNCNFFWLFFRIHSKCNGRSVQGFHMLLYCFSTKFLGCLCFMKSKSGGTIKRLLRFIFNKKLPDANYF